MSITEELAPALRKSTTPAVAYTMKERAGCAGGGKGPLIQKDKSATLATSNDQYLFQPTEPVIAIDKESYNCGEGFNRAPGIAVGGPCATLQTSGTPHAVCYVEVYDARGNGDGETVNTLTGGHNISISDYSTVVCLQGNGIDRADTAGCNGKGWKEDISYTLNTIDRPAVVYENPPRYIVRRLTPTECARLQGFADQWGHVEKKDSLTDEEFHFWQEVRNTHAAINGRKVQDYTEKQMLTWYNKLWTDSAEYKMWGNGIALPPALYCLQGIVDVLDTEDEVTDLSDAPEEIKQEILDNAEALEEMDEGDDWLL